MCDYIVQHNNLNTNTSLLNRNKFAEVARILSLVLAVSLKSETLN